MAGESSGAGAATVLVVEDNRVNRMALVRGVEREGHRALTAADGREALDILAERSVDMLLLDLLMPDVDGFEVLAAMARDPSLSGIPVLVVSAVEETEDIARAIEMGAIDCLPKPFEPVLLHVRLRTALERNRLRRLEQDYLKQELALRRQERLATLGRLSAGLGHEVNNPAAAALSTARQLGAELDRSEALMSQLMQVPAAPQIVATLSTLVPREAGSPGAVERADREEELVGVLDEAGVAQPWTVAADLAGLGVTAAALSEHVGELGDDLGLGVAWLRSRSAIRKAVAQITRSVERIAELTSALRGYAYLDRAPQQRLDVRAGLDDTLTILGHKLSEGTTVVRDYAPGIPAITAYGSQLNQVWTNLVDNAIDALDGRGTLTVRVRADDGGVRVEVEDDGPGIPADLLGQVFDPFVTTKPPGQGTGLGLSISHQIVTEGHGGRITVRSQPGRTVFSVELPAAPPSRSSDAG